MINKEELLKYIQNQGKNTSIEEIEKLINEKNRDEIKLTQEKRFSYEIWDKKTFINGIDPKEILKSRNYTIDKAYLIYIDGKLVYFQDHNPNKTGYVKMNKTQATKIAEKFIDEKIEETVDNIIINYVLETILSK